MRPLSWHVHYFRVALVVLAHSPSVRVIAQEKSSPPKSATQAPANIDPQKDARIRELMDVTGAKNMGEQLIEAGMEQFRQQCGWIRSPTIRAPSNLSKPLWFASKNISMPILSTSGLFPSTTNI